MRTDRPNVAGWLPAVVAGLLLMPGTSVDAQGQESVEGITEPFMDIVVGAAVAGNIAKVMVREGETIKKGQLLLEQEKSLQDLEVKRRKLLWDSKAELDAARLAEDTLKKDYEGTKKLFETTASVSKDELAKKELEYNQAVAERLRLEIVEDRERLDYEIALDAVKLRQITSPLDGEIASLVRDEGEPCSAQDPLFRIVDTSQCFLVCNVDARFGPRFSKDQAVKVEVEAGEGHVSLDAKISFISPVVDPSSGLLEVKALFSNPGKRVRPGVGGRLFIPKAP